jgi:hypothetical protein
VTTENNAVFSLEEKGRVLYHLGYLLQNPVLTLSLGVPALTQPAFLAASAMDRVPESQAQIVRKLIGVMDGLDQQLLDAQQYLVAGKLGEIEINLEVCNALEGEYTRWAQRLADALGAIVNPYSVRFYGGKQPLVVRVRHA